MSYSDRPVTELVDLPVGTNVILTLVGTGGDTVTGAIVGPYELADMPSLVIRYAEPRAWPEVAVYVHTVERLQVLD